MELQLRKDIERIRLGEYAMPLGIEPLDRRQPIQGYTVSYTPAEDEDPDTYAFHIVVSHERLRDLLAHAFKLLPGHVSPIIEVDSYDAYRTVDVYIGREDVPVPRDEFISSWVHFEPVLLEDGAVGAGANSEEPFAEVFVDQWKGVSIHVTVDMRDTVERMLHALGLYEVSQTWPSRDPDHPFDATIRPVLETEDSGGPTLDDVVLELRRAWNLELNVDPDRNLDESGRELGLTLWHVGIALQRGNGVSQDGEGYMSVWATARSLTELESMIDERLKQLPEWSLYECFAVTRVAFDDRPESLEGLPPRRGRPEIHLVEIQEIADDNDEGPGGGGSAPQSGAGDG